LRLT